MKFSRDQTPTESEPRRHHIYHPRASLPKIPQDNTSIKPPSPWTATEHNRFKPPLSFLHLPASASMLSLPAEQMVFQDSEASTQLLYCSIDKTANNCFPHLNPQPPPFPGGPLFGLCCSCFDHKINVEGAEKSTHTTSVGPHADIQEPNWTRICCNGKRKPPPLNRREGKKGFLIWTANRGRWEMEGWGQVEPGDPFFC